MEKKIGGKVREGVGERGKLSGCSQPVNQKRGRKVGGRGKTGSRQSGIASRFERRGKSIR